MLVSSLWARRHIVRFQKKKKYVITGNCLNIKSYIFKNMVFNFLSELNNFIITIRINSFLKYKQMQNTWWISVSILHIKTALNVPPFSRWIKFMPIFHRLTLNKQHNPYYFFFYDNIENISFVKWKCFLNILYEE